MSEPIHIALIDDDEAIREAVADILSNEGYAVDLYKNGREAIEGLAHSAPPHIIICDLVMPVMNGWEFLAAQSTSTQEMGKVPVVVLSATPDFGTFEHKMVCEVVRKPFDIDALLSLVGKHCCRPLMAS